MQFTLTKHAKDVIEERQIPYEYIQRTISMPQKIIPDSRNKLLKHFLLEIPEYENRVLRVVANPEVDPIRVITAYYDRTMRGKI